MLWDIKNLMKPALSVIDMIPDVHRTPALAALRRVVLDGRPLGLKLKPDDKDLAFHDSKVQLTSPVGAQILLKLYKGGHLKLKKPAQKSLPTLEAYAATEGEFRARVAEILAAEDARLDRLAAVLADPAQARPEELTPNLVDKIMTKHLGHGVMGEMEIAGLKCQREMKVIHHPEASGRRDEAQVFCWWIDASGQRQGDTI